MNFSDARLMQTPLCAYHFIGTLLNYKTTLFYYIFVTQFTLIRIITVQCLIFVIYIMTLNASFYLYHTMLS